MNSLPDLCCPRIEFPDADEYSEEVAMQQAWLAVPDELFLPACVRVAWNDASLFVHAVLQDADVFNPVDEFNTPSFNAGDVFEIFLRPEQQDAYFEFHVNPNNSLLQLRIPSADSFT